VQYGNQLIGYLPLLINTPAGIETWKQNKKLTSALKALGMEVGEE
jgi:hypothetical protein